MTLKMHSPGVIFNRPERCLTSPKNIHNNSQTIYLFRYLVITRYHFVVSFLALVLLRDASLGSCTEFSVLSSIFLPLSKPLRNIFGYIPRMETLKWTACQSIGLNDHKSNGNYNGGTSIFKTVQTACWRIVGRFIPSGLFLSCVIMY